MAPRQRLRSTESEPSPRRRAASGPALSVMGTLEQFGPLGSDNRRRQLGRSFTLAGIGAHAQLVFAGASREERAGPGVGESLSQGMVITCSKALIGTLGANSKARVQGILRWGGDGHQTECRFEWLEGTTVHAVGSSITLTAELVLGLDATEPNVPVQCGAFVGYGRESKPATLCERAVTTEGAPTATFEIPPFAVGFQYWANAALGVEWLDGTSVVYAGLGAAALPLSDRGEVFPVVPATHLRLTPSAAGAVILVWVLAV